MENQQKISDQKTQSTGQKPRINFWIISTIVLLAVVIVMIFNARIKSAAKPAVSQPATPANQELSEWYSVEYPSNFFVTRKDYNTFGIAEERWKGEIGHIPEAVIETYTNIITDGMSLRDWLNGVGNPTPPVGDQGAPKSCKEFFDKLRQQLKYGDLFNNEYLKGTDCIYFGVLDIKDKTIAGFPALEFNTQNVSSSATHTIFVYKNQAGSTLLFDIYFTTTGMSDEKDQTVEAYKLFLSTFKLRQ